MTQGFTQEMLSSRVEKIISEQIGSDTHLSLATNLQEDLDMDSLELVELGITLENEFNLSLPDSAVRRCTTINDIVQLISNTEQEHKATSA